MQVNSVVSAPGIMFETKELLNPEILTKPPVLDNNIENSTEYPRVAILKESPDMFSQDRNSNFVAQYPPFSPLPIPTYQHVVQSEIEKSEVKSVPKRTDVVYSTTISNSQKDKDLNQSVIC